MPKRSFGYARSDRVRGTLREAVSVRESPSTQPSKSELRSSRPREERGRGRRRDTMALRQASTAKVCYRALRPQRGQGGMMLDKTIGVAGAGSIGCFVGGMLAAGGRRVALLARPRVI